MIETPSETTSIEFTNVTARRSRGRRFTQAQARLTDEQLDRIDEIADELGWSRAQVLGDAVSRYLATGARSARSEVRG